MPDLLTTGIDLYAWRARLGLSVVGGAAELRIQPTSLRNLEAGRKAASPTLLRLADLLELQHAAPAPAPSPAPAPPVRPARRRKPKPVPLTVEESYAAALAKARLGSLSPEAASLLRAEVDRQRRVGTWDPEPYSARQAREKAWETVTTHAGSLWLSASVIALSMPR